MPESAQSKLLRISMYLKPGQRINVPNELIHEGARAELESFFDRWKGARPSDITKYIEKVSKNWDIIITKNYPRGYTVGKPKEKEEYYYETERGSSAGIYPGDDPSGCITRECTRVLKKGKSHK